MSDAMLYEDYLRMMVERGNGTAHISGDIALGMAEWMERLRKIKRAEADAVPVVRCYECKYLNEGLALEPWAGSCRYWNTHSVDYTWFCSQGERKDGGEDDD